jgi:hypothetical protein
MTERFSRILPFCVTVPRDRITEYHDRRLKSPCRDWLETTIGHEYIDWVFTSFSSRYESGGTVYDANFYFADKTKAALFRLFWA